MSSSHVEERWARHIVIGRGQENRAHPPKKQERGKGERSLKLFVASPLKHSTLAGMRVAVPEIF